jgi:hypothetical protein
MSSAGPEGREVAGYGFGLTRRGPGEGSPLVHRSCGGHSKPRISKWAGGGGCIEERNIDDQMTLLVSSSDAQVPHDPVADLALYGIFDIEAIELFVEAVNYIGRHVGKPLLLEE